MNVRSVTRGDAAVALLALLLLVASFLPFAQADGCHVGTCSLNAWHAVYFPLLPAVFLAGLFGGVLVVLGRFLPRDLRVAGLQVGQWGVAFTVFAAWSALWSVFSDTGTGISHGIGAWLGLLFALLLAAAAVAGTLVPALAEPLLPEQTAQTPQQFHGSSPASAFGGPQQAGGYGYPGAGGPQPGQQPQNAQAPQGAAAQPQGAHPYTSAPQPPAGQQAAGQQPSAQQAAGQQPSAQQAVQEQPQLAKAQDAAAQPQAAAAPRSAPAPQPAAAFSPFWFAVPAVRRLAPEHDPAGPPVGELTPGVWYLAVEERNGALVAQTQEGKRGLLIDTSGIQRG